MPPTGPSWGSSPPPPPPPMAPAAYPPPYPSTSAPPHFRSLRGLAAAMYVLLPIAGLLALATIAVLFIIWMWRAASNLALFGRVRPKFGPGFAIGGWFIPLGNFIIPGMQMFDIDKGSGPRLRPEERARGSALVVCWWIVFIVGRMLGVFAPQVNRGRFYDVSTFNVQNLLVIAGSALSAVAAVTAILVIRQVTSAQEQGLADISSGAAPGGPQPPVAPIRPVAPYSSGVSSPPVAPAAPPLPVGWDQWPGPPGPPADSDPQ